VSSLDPLWVHYALEPARALGDAISSGVLRSEPEDFVVEEDLGFAPAGTGQHFLLKVRKRAANTEWVARELAKLCHCRPMDVGFAGLKDRQAVAIQWFSVPCAKQSFESWLQVRSAEFEVLEAHPHTRKLPRGALSGNTFTIRVRATRAGAVDLAARVEGIRLRGVPNYFGPQRFGRDGSNLSRMAAGPRGLRPAERGFVLSAARSLIFNAVLCERVRDGSWDQLRPGDIANLDGRGSVFNVDVLDETLRERCLGLDIHPTGPMWGGDRPATKGSTLELETRIASLLPVAEALVRGAGMEQERRSLRLAVRDLQADWAPDSVRLRFRLARGGFATTVLREIFSFPPVDL
jgi:tRNA pseudouridine13 synthase